MICGNVTANGGIVYSYNPKSTIGGNVTVPGALPADVFALGTIGGNVIVNGGGNLGAFYVGDQTASIVTYTRQSPRPVLRPRTSDRL